MLLVAKICNHDKFSIFFHLTFAFSWLQVHEKSVFTTCYKGGKVWLIVVALVVVSGWVLCPFLPILFCFLQSMQQSSRWSFWSAFLSLQSLLFWWLLLFVWSLCCWVFLSNSLASTSSIHWSWKHNNLLAPALGMGIELLHFQFWLTHGYSFLNG